MFFKVQVKISLLSLSLAKCLPYSLNLQVNAVDVANMSVEEIASKAKMYGDASVKLYQDARKATAELRELQYWTEIANTRSEERRVGKE